MEVMLKFIIIKLDDGKSIALFEVCVDDSINIDRNRQGLREIAAKHIDQNITHGALVFYYSPNHKGQSKKNKCVIDCNRASEKGANSS